MKYTPEPGSRKTDRQGVGEYSAANREAAGRDYETLRALFMQAPAPILMMSGAEHRFVFVNAPSLPMLERGSADSLMGKTVREALPERAGTGFFEVLDEVYRTGVPMVGRELSQRRVMTEQERAGLRTVGGTVGYTSVGVETYFDFLYQPLRGTTGDVVGVMVQAADVTEMVRARHEAELRGRLMERQWAEIEAMYRTAPIGLALIEPDGLRFVRVNERQAELVGLSAAELVGMSVAEVFPGVPRMAEIAQAAADGEPCFYQDVEGELASLPGVYRHWMVSCCPIFGASGEVEAITALLQETTLHKKAEAALLESEKLAAVGRLASSIAHEINNPLESVINLVFLANTSDSMEEIKRYLTTAEAELERAAAVTTQTLRFHRQSTNAQRVSCVDLFATALSVYRGRFKNLGIVVEARKRAKATVVCMQGEIQQVLAALLGNAADAMPRGGRLLVRSRDATDWRTGRKGLMLTVADGGTGMSQQTCKRIFEAFFSTKGIGGSGLGLWVSQETIARHGGRVLVRSSDGGVWRGSVFEIFLPFDATRTQP